MKKVLFVLGLAVLFGAASCNKDVVYNESGEPKEIAFEVKGDFNPVVETKTTAINDVSGLGTVYCLCYNGSLTVWNVALSKSGNTYYSGHYWPNSNSPGYLFYAANTSLAGPDYFYVSDTSTDIVCEYLGSPSVGSNNTLYLDHIFARIGSFSPSAPSGYSLVSWNATISYSVPTSGCYYTISDASFHSGTSTSSSLSSSNDIWSCPGSASVTVNYVLSKDYWTSGTITNTGSVTLQQGKVNNISGTLPGPVPPPTEIAFSVSVTAWSSSSVSLNF